MMARVTSSLVRGRMAVIFSSRYLAGSLATVSTMAAHSGSSRPTAWLATRGRLASMARRARCQAASGLRWPLASKDLRGGGAAVVGLALRVPERAHALGGQLGRHAAAGGVDHQGVTAHLPVVVHAKARQLGGEVGPVAGSAQQQQPVVAQPVFPVGAGHAVQRGADVDGAGASPAGLSCPSRWPAVPAHGRARRAAVRELGRVVAAKGVPHLQQGGVAPALLCACESPGNTSTAIMNRRAHRCTPRMSAVFCALDPCFTPTCFMR